MEEAKRDEEQRAGVGHVRRNEVPLLTGMCTFAWRDVARVAYWVEVPAGTRKVLLARKPEILLQVKENAGSGYNFS